jgi:hypothetical protein
VSADAAARLRQLADNDTAGQWVAEDGSSYLAGRGWWVDGPATLSHDGDITEADARLIALAPELARLAADMADALLNIEEIYDLCIPVIPALLARVDTLTKENTA